MRLFALTVLLATAAPASAQLLRLPQVPPPRPGPTEGAGEEPASAPAGVSRKLEALEVAGLRLPPSSLQESVTLSARRAWVDSKTFVDFQYARGFSTRGNYVVVEPVPHLNLAFSPKIPNAELVWSADQSKRHIIDCEVGGPATHIKFRWGESGEASAAISGGRVSTVLPTGVAGSVKLSADKEWRFHSCEITPVAI